MESHSACFCAVVVNDGRHSDVGCHAGNGDYVAMVLLDHGWHELPHCQEVREGVDFKGPADGALGLVKNGHGVADGSVVDKDCGVAMDLADLSTDRCEIGGRRDIGFVEVNAGCGVALVYCS